MPPLIVSLFDRTGHWSLPYREAGYRVIQVDRELGHDIFNWTPPIPSERIRGVLAAPPCTHFASLGARHWPDFDASGQTRESVRLVYRTLALIDQMAPAWWCLENPVGRLNKVVPELVPFGPTYIQPYEYGDPYTKKTGLWGRFTLPPKKPVDPHLSSLMHRMSSSNPRRSVTPLGFATAFFHSNP